MIGTEVYLWGTKIGTVVQRDITDLPRFMYDSSFLKRDIEISPIMMPLSSQIYSFPNLREETFHGLPGMLADSLPDKFGNKIIDNYLAKQGRSIDGLTAVERLCYVGKRGMGALEYIPQKGFDTPDQSIDIDELARLADEILSERKNHFANLSLSFRRLLLSLGTFSTVF